MLKGVEMQKSNIFNDVVSQINSFLELDEQSFPLL